MPSPRPPARLSIRQILHPRSVAVFGASDSRDKFGGRIMYFLTHHGFAGRIVPVNPRRSEVFGHAAYAKIGLAPIAVDVAILAVPTEQLTHSIRECAEAGVGCCVIMTTGFAEASQEGLAQQNEIVAIASAAGMRIVGPNCMGFLNPAWNLALCSSVVLDVEKFLIGHVGFISQSGALMVSIFDRAYGDGIGFSACVSLGNQSDLEICDFLDYMIEDPETRAICLYVEGFIDPPRFVRAAAACREAGKPLIIVKTGKTPAGVRAARSHTASLAGSYDAFAAVCRAHGALLADDPATMVRAADALVRWPRLADGGIGVVSSSGGGAGIIVDRLTQSGHRLAKLAPATKEALSQILLPPQADNPIDLGGRKLPESVEIAGTAMATLAADPDVAAILIGLASMPFFEPRTRLLAQEGLASGKPVLCAVLPGPAANGPRKALRDLRCPFVDTTQEAFDILSLMTRYAELRAAREEPPPDRPSSLPAAESATRLVATADELSPLTRALESYGIRLARETLATSCDAAVAAATAIGFPVVLKGVAPWLVHKSEFGAVKTNLADEAALRAAWREITAALAAHDPHGAITGCLVQEMVGAGTELIVGTKWDEQFGAFVMVGAGGMLVELMGDVALAPAPVSHDAAARLLRSLRIARLFAGFRGKPPLDLEAVCDTVVKMSWLAADLGGRLLDLEINPLIVHAKGDGAVAVDVRGTLAPAG